MGEYLAVVGNLKELGSWKDFHKVKLRWTEGHIWVTEGLVISSASHFLYKYVIMQDGQVKEWEKGANRIADLAILPERDSQVKESRLVNAPSSVSVTSIASSKRKSMSPERKHLPKEVEIEDEWEHFKIRFGINDHIDELHQSHTESINLIGSRVLKSGQIEDTPPMRMQKSARPVKWLFEKYGNKVRPYQIVISFKHSEMDLSK